MKKTIDEKTFKAVKAMRAGGASVKDVTECLGISSATLYRIAQADTLDAYQNKVRADAARTPAPTPAPAPLNSAYINNRMYELLKQQNELLTLISAKMAFIVEALS